MGCPIAICMTIICVAAFLLQQLLVGTGGAVGCRGDLSTSLIVLLSCLVPHVVTSSDVGAQLPLDHRHADKFLGHPGLKGIYPYMVFIEPVHCSGTIISESWVLSAAHCYENRFKGLLHLYAGLVNSADKSSTQYRTATRLDHPMYKEDDALENRFYDISLLSTNRPFIFNPFVDMVSLASGSFPKQYGKCKAIGFGLNEDYVTGENALKWMRVLVGGQHFCRQFANKYDYPTSLFGKHVVCATTVEESGKSFCSGDTGGPLLCGGVQVGVLIAAFRRTKKLNPTCGTYTGIFAYVGFHIGWIESVVTDGIMIEDIGYGRQARGLATEHKPGGSTAADMTTRHHVTLVAIIVSTRHLLILT